jgi:caffeoyl-CoA O-methyltransferase
MMSNDLREHFEDYIGDLFAEEDDTLRWIQSEARRQDLPAISIQPQDGYLLQWLAKITGARKAVEIGTLAGYSGVWIGRGLPDDGKLYTIERSGKHAEVARASFDRAGLNGKVELFQGEALDILRKLSSRGPFDMVFIDADKASYPDYLAWAVENLRPGGVLAAHNAYRGGGVLQPENEEDRIMHQFNEILASHPRLNGFIIPLGDGMAVAFKQ